MTTTTIPTRLLLGPGPSNPPPEVLAALGQPTIGHLDPAFLTLMDGLRDKLRRLFQTRNEMTLAMSGTGSAGMETLFVNLVEPGDRVLICVNGVFGGRMVDVAERCGAVVHKLERPWGTVFDPADIIAEAQKVRPVLTAVVHAETSTGAGQPLDQLAGPLHEIGSLFVVDCVTSLAGMPVEIDAWGIDAAYSGTQKCLSCPPGLSPVTLSPRAVAKVEARKRKVQSWYLDLSMIRNYWGQERFYHHTAPINMLYALDAALDVIHAEGLPARFARHRQAHEALRAGLEKMGLRYVSQEGFHLPMLNAVGIPEGVTDAAVRSRLLNEHGIELGGGLGAFKGKAWRIGLMGHNARVEIVQQFLDALRRVLP
jgi:alanine-glyoxylate transaminase/serine-glyoxylate transaminase/serine-pyruvate transaminase